MGPAFHLNTLFHPSHVTVGAHGPGRRTSLWSVIDYLGDPYFTSAKDGHQGLSYSDSEHVFIPNFDISETADAYYLEGEFPGVRDRESIFIEHLGPRGLLIEARTKKLDLSREWGVDARLGRGDAAPICSDPSILDSDGSVRTAQPDGASKVRAAEAVEAKLSTVGTDQGGNKESTQPQIRVLLSERLAGCLQRSFTFPEPVDFKNLKAKLGDGLLRIKIPKAAGASGGDRFTIEMDK